MDSSYSVIPIVRNAAVDPGEVVEIEFYTVGHGPVDAGKLQVFHVQEDLVDSTGPGSFRMWVDARSSISGEPILLRGEEAETSVAIDAWNTTVILEDWFFENIPDAESSEQDLGLKVSEGVHEGHPPLLLRLNTSTAAEPGDYELPVALTYVSDGVTQQASESVSIHINSWVDRHRTIIEASAIVGGIAAILTVLISIL